MSHFRLIRFELDSIVFDLIRINYACFVCCIFSSTVKMTMTMPPTKLERIFMMHTLIQVFTYYTVDKCKINALKNCEFSYCDGYQSVSCSSIVLSLLIFFALFCSIVHPDKDGCSCVVLQSLASSWLVIHPFLLVLLLLLINKPLHLSLARS